MALSLAEKDRKVFHIAVQLLCGDASYTILQAGRDLEDIPLASLVKSRWSTFLSCLEEALASHELTPANDAWDSIVSTHYSPHLLTPASATDSSLLTPSNRSPNLSLP